MVNARHGCTVAERCFQERIQTWNTSEEKCTEGTISDPTGPAATLNVVKLPRTPMPGSLAIAGADGNNRHATRNRLRERSFRKRWVELHVLVAEEHVVVGAGDLNVNLPGDFRAAKGTARRNRGFAARFVDQGRRGGREHVGGELGVIQVKTLLLDPHVEDPHALLVPRAAQIARRGNKTNYFVGLTDAEDVQDVIAVAIPVERRGRWRMGEHRSFAVEEFYEGAGRNGNAGFGLVQVEAMACGCPVINTAIPASGVSWVCRHEKEGLTVPVNDGTEFAIAAKRLVEEGGLRDRLSAAARLRADEFDWLAMGERSLKTYHSVKDRV